MGLPDSASRRRSQEILQSIEIGRILFETSPGRLTCAAGGA